MVIFMEINIVGKNIAELRKSMEITQDSLAKAVGVTSQAVSKWETGGTPDIELLPVIADFFKVSVDRLFSRKVNDYEDIATAISTSIIDLPIEDRYEKVFEYCLALEQSFFGRIDEFKSPSEARKSTYGPHSQTISNEGLTLMSLSEELAYFLIMPEPKVGWEVKLGFIDSFINLFKMLSETDTLKTLYFLYKRENKAFTPKLLEKEIGIKRERAVQILNELCTYEMISTSEIELDDEVIKVYNFNPNPALIAILALSNEIISRPHSFYYSSSSRNKTYFR
jgi:transcriptional regulator with XRE-family HTH domain